MQDYTDISRFKNTSEWRIIHSDYNQLFYLKNANGNMLHQAFTTKRLAQAGLYHYLLSLETKKFAGRPRQNKSTKIENAEFSKIASA